MSVPPHTRLWGKYNEFSLITKYHRPVTAGHTGSSQASMPPDTNPDDFPDPAPVFFVGASEPMFEGPSFWFPDQPLPELPPSFADLPSSALNEPQIFLKWKDVGMSPCLRLLPQVLPAPLQQSINARPAAK
jgi:hypothetical protein